MLKPIARPSFIPLLVYSVLFLMNFKPVFAAESIIGHKGNILMIISHQDFRDEELFQPKDEFERAGYQVTIASTSLEISYGMMGGMIKPDILLTEVDVSLFNAIIFVGGTGASEYFNHEKAHFIARQSLELNRILGAICIAPSTLAYAGVLKGISATCFATRAGHLENSGADYTGASVTVDGNIVTGNGPMAAKAFARKIIQLLEQQ